MCEKDYICNLSTCTFEYGKYLESITNDSVATWDEIIDAARSQPVTFNDKKAASNIDYFYSLLFFQLLILLLTNGRIYYYYYRIKHRSKQK